MKVSRKLILISLLVSSLVVMSIALVSPAAAQGNRPCVDLGRQTGGDFLVDVSDDRNDSLNAFQIQCRVLISREAGTPIQLQRAIDDYDAIAGLDVWTASGFAADFDIYDPPVRICFNGDEFGIDPAAGVGPEELAAGENGPSIMYSDARYTFADRLSNRYLGFSRNFTQLNVITDADNEYLCADISYPGAVLLVPGIPENFEEDDPQHPNYGGDTPDRCLVPDSSDCFD